MPETLPVFVVRVISKVKRVVRGGCRIRNWGRKRPYVLIASMPQSHHSHSGQFCKHAIGLLEDVIKEALNQGFEVYGLTEHVPRYHVKDLYPEEVIRLHRILV